MKYQDIGISINQGAYHSKYELSPKIISSKPQILHHATEPTSAPTDCHRATRTSHLCAASRYACWKYCGYGGVPYNLGSAGIDSVDCVDISWRYLPRNSFANYLSECSEHHKYVSRSPGCRYGQSSENNILDSYCIVHSDSDFGSYFLRMGI